MSASRPEIIAVLLAAGKSRRFGGNKQLAEVVSPQGKTSILERSLRVLTDSRADRVWLAYSTDATNRALALSSSTRARLLPCPSSHLGIGHTIADVAQTLMEQAPEAHVLLFLADQVAVSTQDIDRLLAVARANPQHIVSAQSKQGLSPPVVFPTRYLQALSMLTGDKGAKALLMKNPNNLMSIRMESAGIDIDTRADLLLWNLQRQKSDIALTPTPTKTEKLHDHINHQ